MTERRNNRPEWDRLWTHVALATMRDGQDDPYGLIPDGALAVKDGRIAWCGGMKDLPGAPETLAAEIVHGRGRCMTPGLIDCHTHLVYAGSRADEFERRLQGASYRDIAEAGGGIRATVRATREAALDELVAQSRPRLNALLAEGVTTVEIKTGYGLDLAAERKMIAAAKALGEGAPSDVVITFLGAHTVPDEFRDDPDGYVRLVCEEMIPAAAADGATAVDVFCETIAFSLDQTRRILTAATDHGLDVKLHADQLGDSGATGLAAEFGALSADHVEYANDAGIRAMAAAGTVAVLLPGAFYFLREERVPPVAALRDAGVPIALASDGNPGTSPLFSLLTAMNMGCVQFGLTPAEALAGVTRNGARALGLHEDRGILDTGRRADLVLWPVSDPAALSYQIGAIRPDQIVKNGAPVDLGSRCTLSR